MKMSILLSFAALAPLSVSLAHGADHELRVTATQLRNNKGTVRCLAFAQSDGFPKDPKKAKMRAAAKIVKNTATCVFTGLKPGKYGISFIHDENDDQALDTNFIGIPTEGYGFANDARGSMGPPDFDAAAIKFAGGQQEIRLKTEY